MSTELERRTFIQSAGLFAGAAAATGLVEAPALAQSAQHTGTKSMTYEAKPLSLDPSSNGCVGRSRTERDRSWSPVKTAVECRANPEIH